MSVAVLYLLKCSISLSIVWIFYQLFLRRLTFYNLNRWYLLGYSVLAFFIPLIHLGPIAEEGPSGQPLIIQFIPAIGDYRIAMEPTASGPFTRNGWNYGLALMALGAVFLLIRLFSRWLSLRRIRQQARLIENTAVRIYQVDDNIIPFSFGNAIYINQHLHTEKEWSAIILHEYVHIRQQHTADILLAELVCILNWYNPFAWLLRYSIRQNLEFIADHKVLENGFDKKNYQYHLLKVIGQPRYRLVNNFNFSSLKKRIIMMNKLRSARLHLVKFLFILPLIAVLLLAFRDKYEGIFRRPGERFINAAGIVITLPGKLPLAGVTVREKITGIEAVTDRNGYYKLTIPVTADAVRIHLDCSKKGYENGFAERFWPDLKTTAGSIDVMTMSERSVPMNGLFMVVPNFTNSSPVDPGYEDARQMLQRVLKENIEMNGFMDMETAHPEIGLFYITEDKQKRIVLYRNGKVEKYGYPGQPALADMDKKYGSLPEIMTGNAHPVNSGYLSRWEKISARAEKDFHTTNPTVLRIIFPGDSRVLVIPASGKPEMYDMDNADPKERPSFEKLYGKLPDCVPAAADLNRNAVIVSNPVIVRNAVIVDDRRPSLRADTVPSPEKIVITPDSTSRRPANPTVLHIGEPTNALFVVNGIPMEAGWKVDSLQPENISSVTVIKGKEALALYGERGANGVIDITTKSYLQLFNRLQPINIEDPVNQPLYIVDGVVAPPKAMSSINPTAIQSITILKGTGATAKYGENAKNGVVLITLKATSAAGPFGTDLSAPRHIDVKKDTIAH